MLQRSFAQLINNKTNCRLSSALWAIIKQRNMEFVPYARQIWTTPIVDSKKDMKYKKTTFNKVRVKMRGQAEVWTNMTVDDLAKSTKRSIGEIQEVMVHVQDVTDDSPEARLPDPRVIKDIVNKLGMVPKHVSAPAILLDDSSEKDLHPRPPAPPEKLQPRPPVVTVMGHVDHGKTTLLDTLRGASVAAGEFGGITQHIGAFTVELDNGESVTFLDTPGHAAFSAMRARGANCTDIIVLVVAAEDGVMQQTKEVIGLAKEGNIPMVVAINKIDMPNADIDACKKSLLQVDVSLEEYGGDVQTVCISALHGTNLDQLAEAISTQAVLMELKSEYDGFVEGVVVESRMDVRRGKLSTAIVTRGTLRKGTILVSGQSYVKVRGLFDHTNTPIDKATPGQPVEVLGWEQLPPAGALILEAPNMAKARAVVNYRKAKALQAKGEKDLEEMQEKCNEHVKQYKEERNKKLETGELERPVVKKVIEDDRPKVNIILKGDVHGSVEAILDVIDTYDCSDECRLNIVHYGVGEVTPGDIELAKGFHSIIYAFNIKKVKNASVPIRDFNVIYRLLEDLIKELNSKLPEIDVEEVVGEARVIQIFEINEKKKVIPVLGCRCLKGVLKKNLEFKIMRDGKEIHRGKLESMRHLKNEVDSIKNNDECGLMFEDAIMLDVKRDDIVKCITWKKEHKKINWNPGF